MKRHIFILLILPISLFAQEKDIFVIENLSEKGILLNKNWKFQEGDNQTWANVGFKDTAWKQLNPTLDIKEFSDLAKSGKGWFRLHFKVKKGIDNRLAMMIRQSVASEIFLDGNLIHRLGKFDDNPNLVKAFDPILQPAWLEVENEKEHILAIKVQRQNKINYTTIFETANPVFSITIREMNKAIAYYEEVITIIHWWEILLAGFSLMLFTLHLAIYFIQPFQKAYLYFGIFGFLYFFAAITQSIFFLQAHFMFSKFIYGNLSFLLILVAEFFLMTAIYFLLEIRKDYFYTMLLIFVPIAIFMMVFFYNWGWKIVPNLQMLIHINIIRIAFLASKKRKRGAKVIAIGAMGTLVFFIVFIIQGTFYRTTVPENITWLRLITYELFQLSIPIVTSIYLGIDFAFINQSLKQKLEEVNLLSKRTIAQEKEKQQILISQNEALQKALLRGEIGERKRVATELHDNLNSILASLKVSLQIMQPKTTKESLVYESILKMVDNASREVRQISHNMLPTELEKEGLEHALQALVIRLNLGGQTQFELNLHGFVKKLDSEIAFNLYTICLELCQNIQKHSEASNAQIDLQVVDNQQSDGSVIMFVSDNGKGFEKGKIVEGMGLKNIQHRAKSIGGDLRMQSELGEGTTVYLIIKT